MITLFAAYVVLELAKVCWNAAVRGDATPDRPWLVLVSELLDVAEKMFAVLGPEDDAQTRSSALKVVDHLMSLIRDEKLH
jgi:predicted P-loop ATPase/GTPase